MHPLGPLQITSMLTPTQDAVVLPQSALAKPIAHNDGYVRPQGLLSWAAGLPGGQS
jgi:hypothetical protein